MTTLPRIRTIAEAYAEIRRNDPNTAITMCALRRAVRTGELPSRSIGTKYLLNMEHVEAYLRGELPPVAAAPAMSGIRPVRIN